MNTRLLATVALVATTGFIDPVIAQESQSVKPGTPIAQAQDHGIRVLQTCAQDQANTLPNPWTEVSSNHWAYKAVLSMYYCGAYRGSVPPEQVKQFLESQPAQPTSTQPPSEWIFLETTNW